MVLGRDSRGWRCHQAPTTVCLPSQLHFRESRERKVTKHLACSNLECWRKNNYSPKLGLKKSLRMPTPLTWKNVKLLKGSPCEVSLLNAFPQFCVHEHPSLFSCPCWLASVTRKGSTWQSWGPGRDLFAEKWGKASLGIWHLSRQRASGQAVFWGSELGEPAELLCSYWDKCSMRWCRFKSCKTWVAAVSLTCSRSGIALTCKMCRGPTDGCFGGGRPLVAAGVVLWLLDTTGPASSAAFSPLILPDWCI